MHKKIVLALALSLAACGMVKPANAQMFSWTHNRCRYDRITNSTDAINRRAWARRWFDENPRLYPTTSWKDPRYYNVAKFQQFVEHYANLHYPIQFYPVYADPNSLTAWKPPYKLNYNSSYTVKPADVINDAVCQADCYTPDQEIGFANGSIAIGQAYVNNESNLLTLTPTATIDQIAFITNPVEEYAVEEEDATHDVLVFHAQSGGEIRVTVGHPLVAANGTLRAARDFIVGDQLVREDGSLDTITDITPMVWTGRVHNLRPVTTDLVSNVLVAQGYLSGSNRYQDEFIEELNRLLLRATVPPEAIP